MQNWSWVGSSTRLTGGICTELRSCIYNIPQSSLYLGLANLASRFTSFSTDEIGALMMEFRDYRIAPDRQLPAFVSGPSDVTESESTSGTLDNFWAAMGELRSITDSTLSFDLVRTSQISPNFTTFSWTLSILYNYLVQTM